MPLYFMHLRDGTEQILDPEGTDHASLAELRSAVLMNVRELISADVKAGLVDFRFRIDAEDAEGTIVYTLLFKHAVNFIPETTANDR